MPHKDYKRIMEEKRNKKEEKQSNKSHINIIRTIKDRKRVEMEYLGAVKRQIGYWNAQLEITNSEDKDRYNELKRNIESEKEHIKQIEAELNKINEEIKVEVSKKG